MHMCVLCALLFSLQGILEFILLRFLGCIFFKDNGPVLPFLLGLLG